MVTWSDTLTPDTLIASKTESETLIAFGQNVSTLSSASGALAGSL
jgi:hypothetical protein